MSQIKNNQKENDHINKSAEEIVNDWIDFNDIEFHVCGDINDPDAIVDNWNTHEDWVNVIPSYASADYLEAIKYMFCRHSIYISVKNPGPRVKAWLESRIPKLWAPLTTETFELWDQYTINDLNKDAWPYTYPPLDYIQWLAQKGEYERALKLIHS